MSLHPDYVRPVEMLPVPRLRSLDKERLGGTACVWCGKQPDELISLGTRLGVLGGKLTRWQPHACRPCTGRQAARVHPIHNRTCARCIHRDHCLEARALHVLAMECR